MVTIPDVARIGWFCTHPPLEVSEHNLWGFLKMVPLKNYGFQYKKQANDDDHWGTPKRKAPPVCDFQQLC